MLRALRLLIVLVSVIALGVWSNHCAFSDAFASPKKESSKVQSHCHQHDNSENPVGESHHSKCKGEGCCQPIITPFSDSLSKVSVTVPVIPKALNDTVPVAHESFVEFQHIPEATGPPLRANDLILHLATAPNAPPVS